VVDVSNLLVWLKTNGETWVAATGRAPYFCFVGESDATVTALAGRALDFYTGAAGKIDDFNKGREAVSPEYVIQRKVLGRDLAA
jgi:hypothetical protein